MSPQMVILHFGGSEQNVLQAARELECSPQTIYNWLAVGRVPMQRQKLIEATTGGKLRADKPKRNGK